MRRDHRHHPRRARRGALALAAVVALVTLAACGSSGSDGASTTIDPTPTSFGGTTAAGGKVLRILVTNDDGVEAPGIDALVTGLETLPDVTVTVVAPAEQQSGTGGSITDGPLTVKDATTASGHAAKAVDGFPADTIRAAFDDLGIKADLVVSGINSGQNLSALADISGTIGAARAAVAKGIPALAVSQGVGKTFDYPAAIPFVLDWVKGHRAAVLDGTAAKDVSNMNVPSCSTGKIRGQLELPGGTTGGATLLGVQDCSSTVTGQKEDGAAFLAGFVTLTEPLRPKA